MKTFMRPVVYAMRKLYRAYMPKRVYLVQTEQDQGVIPLEEKIEFYFEGSKAKLTRIDMRSLQPFFGHGPILLYGPKTDESPRWHRLFNGTFDVNERTCAMEAWSWFDARVHLDGVADQTAAREHFNRWQNRLDRHLSKAYIFGTGPSLAKASERNWADGYRIVCNTIVRDRDLWHHINPHAIVAGDALYHFGYTEFAGRFRSDLLARLEESPQTVFIYPDYFHSRVVADIKIAPDRLIPVATGRSDMVHLSLNNDFELPALGNVLNKLLLPVGCALSKNVKLWGFDGRAPDDQLFWANSTKHTYAELMPTLQKAHPSFFDHFVPKDDPESYVRSVHGDVLEHCLSAAEAEGFNFEMMHHSWTGTLQKRAYNG